MSNPRAISKSHAYDRENVLKYSEISANILRFEHFICDFN